MDQQEYEVEIVQTVHATVTIRARNPLSAAKIADNLSYPLPPADQWEHLPADGWAYIVREPGDKAELYRGSAQELS